MKISSVISQIPFIQQLKLNRISKKCDLVNSPTIDVFELSPELKIEKSADLIFNDYSKFDINDFKNLSKTQKDILRVGSVKSKEPAEESLQIALNMKKNFDKRYGEGNYVFVSLGTSPAGIGRCLEYMGVETKYLPASGLDFYSEEDRYKKYENTFPSYVEFLDKQGLSKSKIASSGKEHIVIDYTRSFRSLHFFEKLMKEYFDLDLPNISYHSLNFEMCQSCEDKQGNLQGYADHYFHKYLEGQKIADYAGIPHLFLPDFDKTQELVASDSLTSKKFKFLIMDALEQRGLLKYNPENKKSL